MLQMHNVIAYPCFVIPVECFPFYAVLDIQISLIFVLRSAFVFSIQISSFCVYIIFHAVSWLLWVYSTEFYLG
jgi:hypothetical protein